jgi:hypothetical protein
MFKRLFFGIILFIAADINLFAFNFPVNYSLLNSNLIKDSSAFYFNFDNANFLWNNEFFNDIIVGYTLIGFYVTPQIEYHFSENFKIDAGVHLLKYSGENDFSTVTPVYSVTFSKKNYSFIMGTLQGTVMHKLSDQLYYSEKYFTDNIENGIQFKIDKNKFWLDSWINWQTFIFPGDNKQEEILFGTNIIQRIFTKQNFILDATGAIMLKHHGGQIDSTDLNIKTLANYRLGFNLSKQIKNKFIDKVSILCEFDGFSDASPNPSSIYNNGYGIMSYAKISNKTNYFRIGYWYADRFLSSMGHPIFQCKSINPALNKRYRSLITANIFYSKNIYNNIYLGLAGDLFYDTKAKQTDYSMGVSIIIKGDFFITRLKH